VDMSSSRGLGELPLVTWFMARPVIQKCSVGRPKLLARSYKTGVIPIS